MIASFLPIDTPEFRAQAEEKVMSLRRFLAMCSQGLLGARLVQQAGVDFHGAVGLALEELETQVIDAMRRGEGIDWLCRNGRLYLRVFAVGEPTPSWERIFAEEDLADVRAILGDAQEG